ncbi:hypothetical protein BDW68DRAFT_175730 [Aspergillus falconensis]
MIFTTLTRPALGQIAGIGDLYDARTDTFSTISLFTKPPPPSAVTLTENNSSDIKYVHTDSYKEKFSNFGISPQLSASVAAGLISVGGSGRYLTSRRDTKLTVQSSLIYNIATISERINFQHQELEDSLALNVLKEDIATHVVAEINWGSRNVVTVRQAVSREDDVNVIAGNLNAQLKSMRFGAGGEFVAVDAQRSMDNSFEVSVEGDVVATDGLVPTNLASAEIFIGNVKKYIDATNGGKGKPISYSLLPLSDLARLLKVQIANQITLRELSSNCAEQFVQTFDEIASVRQELKDYEALLWAHKEYVSRDDISASTEAVQQVQALESRLRTQYTNAISNVRAGKEDESVLWKALDDFQNTGTSLIHLTKLDFRPLREKIQLIAGLVSMGAEYIGFNSESFDHELGRTPDTDIYVFNFSQAARREDKEWSHNISIIYQLFREQSPSRRILLRDCDAMEEALDKSKIVLYRNAEVLIEDILEQRSKPMARYNSAHLDRGGAQKPVSRIAITLPCPGKNCSNKPKHDWICSKCGCQIEYGHLDTYIYSDCGRCKYEHWDFRCPDQRHGPEFEGYKDVTLLRLLDKLQPFDECNILILGRTGVGKSTWINSLANYLTYPTLDSALAADSLSWIIPFAFTTYKTNDKGGYESIKVQGGFDSHLADSTGTKKLDMDEHDGSTGQSATQRTIVHRLQLKNCLIQLIDTPGIGDTRGASRDKENMADILRVLQSFPQLHGILILLKPNEQKLDLMFKFCMQELLTHLHRDAARNIVFGFTNTRGTNYQPGDSFGPLSQLLGKFSDVDIALRSHNVYCFDSECFRYLAARKLNGQFLGTPEENRRSWEYSVGESMRLLKYFQGLEPHQVNSSLNLYATRTCIVKMAQPMAQIAQAIQSSIAVNKQDMRTLEENKKSRKELEKDLKIKVSTITAFPIDEPRTTCHHEDCIRYATTESRGVDGKQVSKTVYKSMCHSPCHLTGVTVENIGNAKLSHCAAMDGENCTVCGHSWKNHLHIDYEQVEGMAEADNENIVRLLRENANFAEMKQAAIEAKQAYIGELESELQELTSAAAQFSCFLKRNAIMPYNDATLDYLDRTIEDEKGKVAAGGSQDMLGRLFQYREQYQQEIKILNDQMAKGENSRLLDRAGVVELVQKMHSLTHYGQMLKDIGIVVDKIQSFERREKPHVLRARSHTPRQRGESQDMSAASGDHGYRQRAWESFKAATNWH